jgi:hypothetical protein
MSKRIGNGVTRMLPFHVGRARVRVDEAVSELGRDAFVNETRTASLLDCSYGRVSDLRNMRRWTRHDLGLRGGDRITKHYENNQLGYFYGPYYNRTRPFEITRTVLAVLVHDISRIIQNNGEMVQARFGEPTKMMFLQDICDKLNHMDHRPWPTWCAYGEHRFRNTNGRFECKGVGTKGLARMLTKVDIHTVRVKNGRTRIRYKDLGNILKRYPECPKLDMTKYTRDTPQYILGSHAKNHSGRWHKIHYNLGDIQDYLVDPWPMLKTRNSITNITYCIGSPKWWAGPMSRNTIVKIGFSEDIDTYAGRLLHYRASSHFPSNPIVHWAIKAPTRLVLEKRLHNIYMDRQVDSVGRGQCGGEHFETSPKRWSPERMLNNAVKIVESYGHRYKVLKEGDFNRSQREKARGCLWA